MKFKAFVFVEIDIGVFCKQWNIAVKASHIHVKYACCIFVSLTMLCLCITNANVAPKNCVIILVYLRFSPLEKRKY